MERPAAITILIVEDDKTVRETLALNLRAEGYEVLAAEDGEAGLKAGREGNPDLGICTCSAGCQNRQRLQHL